MDTLEVVRTKRAVRQFTEQPVPDETIHRILDAGRRAQSSKNTQPWTFIVIRDRERLRELAACGTWAGHIAGAAFAVVIVAHTDWDFDIGQAAAYLQLAAWDLGVGSCLAYFQEHDRARTLLGVPEGSRCEIGLSFGYPLEAPLPQGLRTGRKKMDEVIRWETW